MGLDDLAALDEFHLRGPALGNAALFEQEGIDISGLREPAAGLRTSTRPFCRRDLYLFTPCAEPAMARGPMRTSQRQRMTHKVPAEPFPLMGCGKT